jgi:hypothetical protein
MTGGVKAYVDVDPRTCSGEQAIKPVVTAVIVVKLALQTGVSRKLSFFKLQVLMRIDVV